MPRTTIIAEAGLLHDGSLDNAIRLAEAAAVTVAPVAAGERFEAGTLAAKKPGTGVRAARLDEVVGRRALRDIAADEVVADTDVDWS